MKGYKQKPGIDYHEVFAPANRIESVRMLVALAAQNKWKIYQMDVKLAFLNGFLEEEVYIDQSIGYVKEGSEGKVYRLKKALYGLKQASRAWYTRIDSYLHDNGFVKCPDEHAIFFKSNVQGDMLLISLYVDDLISTGNNVSMFDEVKRAMIQEFETIDMGLMSYYLGIEVNQMGDGIFLSQKKYASEILQTFRMEDSKIVNTLMLTSLKLSKEKKDNLVDPSYFKSLIRSIRYLTATRPYIVFSVGVLSHYMDSPSQIHLQATKRILCYIKGTVDGGIFYNCTNDFALFGFSDSDWAGDVGDRKSTFGYVFYIGICAFTWSSKKQVVFALSTAEAEYVALASSSSQAIYLRRLIEEMNHPQKGHTMIYCDNNTAISLT